MRGVIIHHTTRPNGDEGYIVTSWGNGTAYELRDRRAKRSVFFQGDDALTFEAELEASIEARGLNEGISFLVGEYAEIMEEDEA